MKRFLVGLIFLLTFLVTYLVIPEILQQVGWYNFTSILILDIVNQLVILSIPVVMLMLITEIKLLRLAGYSLLGINVGFLLVNGFVFTGSLAGYGILLLVVCNMILFVVGLNIGVEFYFGRRVRGFLVILAIVIFFRYSPILDPVFNLILDYSANTGKDWNIQLYHANLLETLYVFTFILELFALDAVLEEKEELGYE